MRGAVRCVRERREPQGAQQLRGRRTAGRTTRKGGVQARTMAGALRLLQRDPPLLSRPVAPSAHRRPARPTRPAAARPRSEWQQPRAATIRRRFDLEGSTSKARPPASTRLQSLGTWRAFQAFGLRPLAVETGQRWRVSPGGRTPARGCVRVPAFEAAKARLPCFHLQPFMRLRLHVRAAEPAWHALPLPPRPAGTRPLQPRPGASACLRGRRRCGSARGGGDLRRCSVACVCPTRRLS